MSQLTKFKSLLNRSAGNTPGITQNRRQIRNAFTGKTKARAKTSLRGLALVAGAGKIGSAAISKASKGATKAIKGQVKSQAGLATMRNKLAKTNPKLASKLMKNQDKVTPRKKSLNQRLGERTKFLTGRK